LADDINDFLGVDEGDKFKGLDEIVKLLKQHSIYKYKLSGCCLTFIAVGNIKFKVIYTSGKGYRIKVAKDAALPFMDEAVLKLSDLIRLINRWIMIYKRSYTDPVEYWPDWND